MSTSPRDNTVAKSLIEKIDQINYENPTVHRGFRYENFNTKNIVTELLLMTRKTGKPLFELRDVKTRKSKYEGKGAHLIKLKMNRAYYGKDRIAVYPELIILNSNDGTSKLKLFLCALSEGMNESVLIPTTPFSIGHQTIDEKTAIELVKKYVEAIPKFMKGQQELTEIELDEDMVEDVITSGLQIRFGKQFDLKDVQPIVQQMKSHTAWEVTKYLGNLFFGNIPKFGAMGQPAKSITSVWKDIELTKTIQDLVSYAVSNGGHRIVA